MHQSYFFLPMRVGYRVAVGDILVIHQILASLDHADFDIRVLCEACSHIEPSSSTTNNYKVAGLRGEFIDSTPKRARVPIDTIGLDAYSVRRGYIGGLKWFPAGFVQERQTAC
jgi:hypothetical protein